MFELKSCPKTHTRGQDKAAAPAETVRRVKDRLVQAGLKVIQKTERIDTGRLDIPVYVSRCGPDAAAIMPTAKQMGKGAFPEQAEASAVMELVERFSFFAFNRRRDLPRGPFDRHADRALPFEHLAASVHHDPNDLDRARQALRDLPLTWTEALRLNDGRRFLIPWDWFYTINEFNGSSAGNTYEEAVLQGLCEVVERHTSAVVAREKRRTPTIDPDSMTDPEARALVDKFRRNDITFILKDFSLDTGLPTVAAFAYDPGTFPALSELVLTAGTASEPDKAAIRALTEVAQLAGDFASKSNFLPSGLPKYTQLDEAQWLFEGPTVGIDALPDLGAPDIKTEIDAAAAVLSERGFPVYAVDAAHPRLEIPAVYVIAPGTSFYQRAENASVPFFAAKMMAENLNPPAAQSALARLAKLYPDSYFIHFHLGQLHLDHGRLDQAADAFDQALKLAPPPEDHAAILTYKGLALKEMEQYPQAIEVLERSAEIDPGRRDTFNLLGFCHFKTKQHRRAVQAFEKVLAIDPGSAIDHANIAVNYREMGQTEMALEYFRSAHKLDPSMDWVADNIRKLEG